MNFVRTIRSTIIAASLLGSALLGGTAAATPNTSTYTMQLSGNTVYVYETNSEAVNAAEADFTYTGAVSSFDIAPAAGSTFTTCPSQPTSTSVSCGILGGSASVNVAHLVASLTFTPKAGVSNASVKVSMASSSSILATTDNTETLNRNTLPSVTYTYTAPVTTPPSTGTTTPTKTSSTSTSTTPNTSTAASTKSTGSTSTGTTSTTNASQNTSGKNDKPVKHSALVAKSVKSSHTGLISVSLATLLVVLVAVYWLVFRKHTELATTAPVYKLNKTSTKNRVSKGSTSVSKKTTKKSQATKKSK